MAINLNNEMMYVIVLTVVVTGIVFAFIAKFAIKKATTPSTGNVGMPLADLLLYSAEISARIYKAFGEIGSFDKDRYANDPEYNKLMLNKAIEIIIGVLKDNNLLEMPSDDVLKPFAHMVIKQFIDKYTIMSEKGEIDTLNTVIDDLRGKLSDIVADTVSVSLGDVGEKK